MARNRSSAQRNAVKRVNASLASDVERIRNLRAMADHDTPREQANHHLPIGDAWARTGSAVGAMSTHGIVGGGRKRYPEGHRFAGDLVCTTYSTMRTTDMGRNRE